MPNKYKSNVENILRATIDGTEDYNKPLSNVEKLLVELKDTIESGASSTSYATALSLTIDSSTYVMTARLLNKDGESIGAAQTIDLPLESMVVSGSYNSVTKKVILTLKNGQTVEFSIADLVEGLASQANLDALTARLDAEKNLTDESLQYALNAYAMPFEEGKYINLSGSTTDYTRVPSSTGYKCAVIDCAYLDDFCIKGEGGSSPLLWGFVDSNGTILTKSRTNATADQLLITAPTNAVKVVINSKASDSFIIKGKPLEGANGNKYLKPYIYITSTSNVYGLTDFNTFPLNSVAIISSINTPVTLQHSPVSDGVYGTAVLSTYGGLKGTSMYLYTQTLKCSNGAYYVRTGYNQGSGIVWNDWRSSASNSARIITVAKSGTRDYSTIKAAFEAAHEGDTIKIEAGEYDLLEEFGADYFNEQKKYYSGLLIDGFNVHMSPQTFVKCLYTGSNASVNTDFSPFNVSAKDCEIIGGNIIATNCRYCIHDDPGPLSDQTNKAYKHVIKNVYMKKTDNNLNWSSQRCLGGGLGRNGEVIVENCCTECDANDSTTSGISYHNNETVGSKGYVVIRDNYCGNNGSIRCAWKGNSETITKMLVCNNSVGSPIVVTNSTGTTTPSTIDVKQFNNELRS